MSVRAAWRMTLDPTTRPGGAEPQHLKPKRRSSS